MKLPSGKRFGQSEYEMALAVFYSFFLHSAVIFVALFLNFTGFTKTFYPPSYQVKLVGRLEELAPAVSAGPAAPEPAKQHALPKPVPKLKKAAAKPEKAAPKKSNMPELDRQKQKATQKEKPETLPTHPSTAPSVPPTTGAAKAGGVAAGVGQVKSTAKQITVSPYLEIIRERIEQNWNPPPGVRNMTVKVLFPILRSGRVGDPKLEQSSGNSYFDMAALRAILASSPFPPLPEEFFKEYEMFSVDLMEKE